jgi:DNA-nicking Smr family endonuclease
MASPDDEFRKAVAGAEPLKARPRAEAVRPAAKPVALQRRRDEAAVLEESLADGLSMDDIIDAEEDSSFLRDGVSAQTLRRLRRGHWAIEASLDLHGLDRRAAAEAMVAFLGECSRRAQRCVRIVHGKGTGLLRAKLRKWLPQREEVLAYCQAPANDGGSGVLLVLLRGKSR